MPKIIQFTDLMGLVFLMLALGIVCVANIKRVPRLADEERELLAGGSLFIAILGTFFVLSE
jgi:hypothetical protein